MPLRSELAKNWEYQTKPEKQQLSNCNWLENCSTKIMHQQSWLSFPSHCHVFMTLRSMLNACIRSVLDDWTTPRICYFQTVALIFWCSLCLDTGLLVLNSIWNKAKEWTGSWLQSLTIGTFRSAVTDRRQRKPVACSTACQQAGEVCPNGVVEAAQSASMSFLRVRKQVPSFSIANNTVIQNYSSIGSVQWDRWTNQ